ncbi:hypothetical protein [Streptacidiphilus sp. PAMC 29251]
MSMPTAWEQASSASVSSSGSRAQISDSSSMAPSGPCGRPWARGCSSGGSGGAGSTGIGSDPGVALERQIPSAPRWPWVGGRTAAISSIPQVAPPPTGVITRAAYVPSISAISGAGRVAAASPQSRGSSAPQGSTASCTHRRRLFSAGR